MSLKVIVWVMVALAVIAIIGVVRKLKVFSDNQMKEQDKMKKWRKSQRMKGE